jgi:hypothetical protein
LAKTLSAGSHKVTILQDTCDKATQPFCSYDQLKGVTVVDTKLKDLEAMKKFLSSGTSYDAVVDNNSKSVEAATCIADAVKSYGPDSQYLYVSSGGMYKGKSPAGGYLEADGEVSFVSIPPHTIPFHIMPFHTTLIPLHLFIPPCFNLIACSVLPGL